MYVVMLAFSVLLLVAAGAIYLRQPSASIFHPATWYLAFHGLVFVIRPIFAWHYGYDNIYEYIGFRPSPWNKIQVLICTNLGLIAFMAVALRIARGPFAFPPAENHAALKEALLRRFWIIAVPLGALAVWSLYWRWNAMASGIPLTVMDQRTGDQHLVGVGGYFYGAVALSTPLAAMLVYLGRFKWWTWPPVAGFAVLQLGTGGRADCVAMGVMIAVMFMHDRRRRWPAALLIVAALAAVPVFHVIKSDRGEFLRETLRPGTVDLAYQQTFDDKPLETMDLAHMEFFEYLVWAIPKRTGTYDYFVNNLELATGLIPRAIWPGKPAGAPIKRFELYEDTQPIAITHSLPGMGWYNAGYPGVLVWCALFAAIYAAAFRAFARSTQRPLAVMAYAIFLATAPLAFRDGLLQTLARQLMFYAAPLVALALLAWWRPAAASPDGDIQAG